MLAHVGPMLALCWPNLALSCPYVDPMFAYVTPILPLCWPYVGVHGPYLALCWPYVGLSYPYLAPMLTLCSPTLAVQMRVTPSRSAAGAARLYNLRLPPKASGKDTGCGCWPSPGFKGWRLTAGRRPKGCYVGPMFASLGPIPAQC